LIVADFRHPLPRPQFREISVKFLHWPPIPHQIARLFA
jgi:hypothetical protein